jgi:transcriptional regulator with XRE-family HTH domain
MPEEPRAVRLRVGSNVQRLRKWSKVTQEKLAESAGHAAKHIGQIERGEVNVGLDVLARIAKALSVDVADLFATPRRRRAASPLFIASARELDQIEQAVRRIRGAHVRSSGDE